MEKNDLQIAMGRAEAKHGQEWPRMSQKEQADAIYNELRELDQRTIAQRRHIPPNSGQTEVETSGSLARP
jgi:hypothetical protein